MAHSLELTNKILATVKSVIETDIVPALAEHAGSCRLVQVDIHPKVVVVVIDYEGTCSHCHMGEQTLEMIKNYLTEELRTICNWKGRVNVISSSLYEEVMGNNSGPKLRDEL